MKRTTMFLLFFCGCSTPPQPSAASVYADNLREIYLWDPVRGAEGHFAYDAMLASDPVEAVPILVSKLGDLSPTAIHDDFHDPVPVAHVALHLLLKIFGMRPADLEREGVWISQSEPTKNPIYQVKFLNDEARKRVAMRFQELAAQRGWLPQAKK